MIANNQRELRTKFINILDNREEAAAMSALASWM
jgi:hypothetical protein